MKMMTRTTTSSLDEATPSTSAFNKAEIERTLNEVLGVRVKWSKLSQIELAQIYVLFTNVEALKGVMRRLRQNEGMLAKIKDVVEGRLERWVQESEGTIPRVIREAREILE